MPYKKPLSEPYLVKSIKGNKIIVEMPDGTMHETHKEDVCKVPDSIVDYERPKEDLQFADEDQNIFIDFQDSRRSPGMMMEDEGQAFEEHQKVLNSTNQKAGWKTKLSVGSVIVYSAQERTRKLVNVGKIISISKQEKNAQLRLPSSFLVR